MERRRDAPAVSSLDKSDPWWVATWEGAAEANLLDGAALTLAQRLEWLQEAGRIYRHLAAARPEVFAAGEETEGRY